MISHESTKTVPLKNRQQGREEVQADNHPGAAGEDAALSEEKTREFWSKVNKNGPLPDQSLSWYKGLGSCWEWTGSRMVGGYGRMHIKRKAIKAHRASWIIHFGAIRNGLLVLHKCDNDMCVNPSHLKLGTHQENMDDMKSRKRHRNVPSDLHWTRLHPERVFRGDSNPSRMFPEKVRRGDDHYSRKSPWLVARGERKGSAKLKEVDVLEIRRLSSTGMSSRQISFKFNVSGSLIQNIVAGIIWKHLL